MARSWGPGVLQPPVEVSDGDQDSLADADARNLTSGDGVVGEGTGDAKDSSRFFDDECQAIDRLVPDEGDRVESPAPSPNRCKATSGMKMCDHPGAITVFAQSTIWKTPGPEADSAHLSLLDQVRARLSRR